MQPVQSMGGDFTASAQIVKPADKRAWFELRRSGVVKEEAGHRRITIF